MNYDKRIITHRWGNNSTHDEYTNCNGLVMAANHYRNDVAFMREVAAEAKQDFPFLKDEEIRVFVVTASLYNKGFWGVMFPLPAETTKKGYRIESRLDFHYA